MIFFCKHCNNEFEVDDTECATYYNWKCPDCQRIAMKKDMALGVGIIWKCDTGTTARSCYKSDTAGSSASPQTDCSCCCKK